MERTAKFGDVRAIERGADTVIGLRLLKTEVLKVPRAIGDLQECRWIAVHDQAQISQPRQLISSGDVKGNTRQRRCAG